MPRKNIIVKEPIIDMVQTPELEQSNVSQIKIAHVNADFGREDINKLGHKINEIIDFINNQ